MRTPDVNILLYAVNADCAQQAIATRWLEQAYDESGGIAFAWVALLGFVRIATRRGIYPNPLSLDQALGQVDTWLHHPRARLLHPTDRHAAVLARLLIGAGRGGDLVTDAHLAALAIEHSATLGTFDRDFERFPGLRVDILAHHAVHER
jgi:toxin-antitoxin system PIN domain toxin